jgi:phospholipid transport system substrate-binding protein
MLHLTLKTMALALALNLVLAVPGAPAGQPTEIVKSVLDQTQEILRNPAFQRPERKAERRRLIKQTVDRRFDYREMARRSLGATWRNLSNSQRDDFVRLFAQLLEASYSDKIEKYAGNVKIDYIGENLDEDYAEVRTVVVRANDRIPFNYRLLNEDGGWKVYDVVIEGVSLVSNYRSQFSRIIHESSYTELVRRLQNKVNELQATGGALGGGPGGDNGGAPVPGPESRDGGGTCLIG